MRWVCPRCQSEVSVALAECPYCPAPGPPAEPPMAESPEPLPQAQPSPRPTAPQAAAPSATPESADFLQRLREATEVRRPKAAWPRRAPTSKQELETPFWRGVKMGVGFMLAVAVILLLLALLLFWLSSQPGWRPWFERLSR